MEGVVGLHAVTHVSSKAKPESNKWMACMGHVLELLISLQHDDRRAEDKKEKPSINLLVYVADSDGIPKRWGAVPTGGDCLSVNADR